MTHSKKKILFVITKSNFGGAQRYVFDLATSLPREDFEVSVALGGDGLLKKKLEGAGIVVFSVPHFERDISFGKEFRAASELAGIVRNIRPDILHLNSSKAGGVGALVGRLMGVPRIVFTAHGWPFFEKRNMVWKSIVWFLSWITALLSHEVILVSEHDRQHAHMPWVRKKFTVIHTATVPFETMNRTRSRTTLFTGPEQNAHRHDFWVVTVAELTANKNIKTALDAIHLVNRVGTRKIFYTVIGAGELDADLKSWVGQMGDEESVKFAGFVEDAHRYLSAFDAFLLPSKKEGLPYVLLEAGIAELPVVASAIGGIPEIVVDGVTGYLVCPDDASGFADKLSQLMGQQDASALGKNLGAHIRKEFSLTDMVSKTQALYFGH